MSNKESTGRTLGVAIAVCLVCSIIVASAAVILKPVQQQNSVLDMQRNILSIAGLGQPGMSGNEVRELFNSRITPRIVDLESGHFSDAVDPRTYDPLQAARDPELSHQVDARDDIASIRRRERYATVYLVENNGQLETLILPVRGYGLWSTLYGFMALEPDIKTVAGFGFYQHGETPGLGGEVDNPRWKSLWPGKKVYDDEGQMALHIVKGSVDPASPRAPYQIDGLAGATLTSKGVEYLLQYWLGQEGFGPFLANLRKGEA